jgi:hypothetical protein
MTLTHPAKYRNAAEQCRKKARSFMNSSEWVRISQDWERLAQLAEALSVGGVARRPGATHARDRVVARVARS